MYGMYVWVIWYFRYVNKDAFLMQMYICMFVRMYVYVCMYVRVYPMIVRSSPRHCLMRQTPACSSCRHHPCRASVCVECMYVCMYSNVCMYVYLCWITTTECVTPTWAAFPPSPALNGTNPCEPNKYYTCYHMLTHVCMYVCMHCMYEVIYPGRWRWVSCLWWKSSASVDLS